MACKGSIDGTSLVHQVEQLSTDMGLLHTITQGDEKATAKLGGKETPSVRKLVSDITRAGDGAVALAKDQADRAEQCADRSCECAESARNSVEQATNIAESMPGFVNGAHAFFGLYMEDGNLMVDKYEDGEVIEVEKYLFTTILPAGARFYFEGSNLMLELPFTA